MSTPAALSHPSLSDSEICEQFDSWGGKPRETNRSSYRDHASTNLRRLSAEAIEKIADELLWDINPRVFTKPQAAPLQALFDLAKADFGLVIVVEDLGLNRDDQQILGRFDRRRPMRILIDHSVLGTIRASFTLAHEYAHFLLHRNVRVSKQAYHFRDTERDFESGHKKLTSPGDWIEWQANRLAAGLLMPRTAVLLGLQAVQRDIGIVRNIGRIYVDSQPQNTIDYGVICCRLSEIFQVSNMSVRCRLSDLDLVQFSADSEVRTIRSILDGYRLASP
jgi:Zn-dependent peptidase ImmA (M78 family)